MAPSAPPGPDDRVQLVDEEHHVAGRQDLLHDPLQPFLELAAVLRSRHEGGEIEGEHPLADQHLGHRPVDDLLREPLHDGGLSHARLADEDGIVLRPARQDLDDPLDLLLPPDDRVQLVLPRKGGEVPTELVEGRGRLLRGCRRLLLARLRGCPLVVARAADLQDRLPQPVGGDIVARQVARHDAPLLLDGGEQQVLGPDVLVAHVPGLFGGIFEDLLAPLRGWHVPEDEPSLALRQALLDFPLHLGDADLDALQRLDRDPFPVLQERKDDVLGKKLVRVEALGFLLGQDGENFLCPLRETFKHGVSLPSPA